MQSVRKRPGRRPARVGSGFSGHTAMRSLGPILTRGHDVAAAAICNAMQCQNCQTALGSGVRSYRLSILPTHAWRKRFGAVAYICARCARKWDPVRSWGQPRQCENCGRTVIHDWGRRPIPQHVVCGQECRRAIRNKPRPRRGPLPERRCPMCVRPFQPPRMDALYCSSPCRQRAYRQRHRAEAA
jgi:hypothetical protein